MVSPSLQRHPEASTKKEDKRSPLQVRGRKRKSVGERDPQGARSKGQSRIGADCQGQSPGEKKGRRVQDCLEESRLQSPESESGQVSAERNEKDGVMAPPTTPLSEGSGSYFFEGASCTDEGPDLFRQLWELLYLQTSTWSSFRAKCCVMFHAYTCFNVVQLGIGMMQLLLSMPREASEGQQKKTTPSRRQRDILPLPMPSVGAAVK